MNIPNMKEKTLRYPGHVEIMKIFRETGFFSSEAIDVNGSMIRPVDFTSRLLFPLWKLEEEDREFTVMQIDVEGEEAGKKLAYRYRLMDWRDANTGVSSMSRTTGYSCTAMAELVLNGQYHRIGISPPEFVGATEGCFQEVLDYLSRRGVDYRVKKEELS